MVTIAFLNGIFLLTSVKYQKIDYSHFLSVMYKDEDWKP